MPFASTVTPVKLPNFTPSWLIVPTEKVVPSWLNPLVWPLVPILKVRSCGDLPPLKLGSQLIDKAFDAAKVDCGRFSVPSELNCTILSPGRIVAVVEPELGKLAATVQRFVGTPLAASAPVKVSAPVDAVMAPPVIALPALSVMRSLPATTLAAKVLVEAWVAKVSVPVPAASAIDAVAALPVESAIVILPDVAL